MKQIAARFNSKCAETGKPLRRGETIFYDTATKKAYHPTAKAVTEGSANDEAKNTSAYIQAQEDAYWNRATGGYYSK